MSSMKFIPLFDGSSYVASGSEVMQGPAWVESAGYTILPRLIRALTRRLKVEHLRLFVHPIFSDDEERIVR